MTIYVDNLIYYSHKPYMHYYWCHMVSDVGNDELHEFARIIGVRREWFQDHRRHPHYDLTKNKRILAIFKGAKEIDTKDLFAGVLWMDRFPTNKDTIPNE